MCKSKVLTTINTHSNFQNKNPNPLAEERTSVPGLPADQGSRGAPVIFPSCWQSAWLQGHIEGQHLLCFRKSTICAVSASLRGHTPVQRFVCQVVAFTNGQSTTKRFFWFALFVPFATHWVPPYSSFCLAQISICLSIWVLLGTFNFLTRMHLIQFNFYICYQK